MRRIFFIILIVVLVWAGVWYFYVRPKQNAGVAVPSIVTSFFPKAATVNNTLLDQGDNLPDGTSVTKNNSPLKQVTSRPVAGYSVFALTTQASIPSADPKIKPTIVSSTDHYLRYVSRTNGYVYEIKNGGVATQISNIFIPNIYEAFFADGNNTALLRFLRPDNATIATYSVPIPPLNPDGTRTQKPGIYLPDNISALTVSPDQKQVLRITTDKNGSIISTSTSTGASVKTVLHSPFREWLPQWTATTMYLQTKAASVASGFLYSIDPTARLRRIVGDVSGLTTSVSPSGTYIIYSQSTDNSFVTKIYNTKTNTTNSINITILPENCTWLQNEDLICAGNDSVPNGTYPDQWYAGTIHLSDQLYEITPSSNTYSVLYNGDLASFDMTNVQVDEGQSIVYFIDKKTGLLWKYSY